MGSLPQVIASPFSFSETQQRIGAQPHCCAFSFGPEQRYSACALTPPTFAYRDGLASFAERQQITDVRSLLENFFSPWESTPCIDPYVGFAGGKSVVLNFETLLEFAGKSTLAHQESIPQCYGITAENIILLDHQEKQAKLVSNSERGLHTLEQQLQCTKLPSHTPKQHTEMKRQPSYQELMQTLAPLSNTGAYTFVQRSSQAADHNAWSEALASRSLEKHAVLNTTHHAACAKVLHNIFSTRAGQLYSSISLPHADQTSQSTLQQWEFKLAEHHQALQQLTGIAWTEHRTLQHHTLTGHFRCHTSRHYSPVAVVQALCASPFFLPSARELHAIARCEKHERRSCGGATILWNGQHLNINTLGETWEYHDQQLSHFEHVTLDTAESTEQHAVSFW